jgi:anaerobic selenocysteine-containing dehydrogenase
VNRGGICFKCGAAYNQELLDHGRRLTEPLKRVGAKGTGSFEPISWEAALSEIADQLKDICNTSGARTILNTHYTGTISLLAFFYPMRFFNRIGATEVNPDTICNLAGQTALTYLLGSALDGVDPRNSKDSNCVLVWGANPSATAPHAHRFWLPEVPGKVIVVDPIKTPTAQNADLHLQPYPGSDAALAFSMMHVIQQRGLTDLEFLSKRALGWELLEPQLATCTPEWGEKITGVPASAIEESAIAFGHGPSIMWLGQGLQRQPRGGNVFRACATLAAVTGNLGKRGAGVQYLNWNLPARGLDVDYVAGADLAQALPPSISHMDLVSRVEDPSATRALFCWNNNIVASNPEQQRLREALCRSNLLTVALDLFPTDTTDYADFVLPAASFLEFDDLVAGYFHPAVSAQVKASDPPGAALPNQEIFRRLSRAMGYTEEALYEPDRLILDRLVRESKVADSFSTLAEKGTVWPSAAPEIQFPDLKFDTPSGKIEIASQSALDDGFSLLPEPWADERPGHGKFRLLTPASELCMNSSFANVEKVMRRLGPATVGIHPEDAAARNLQDGQQVVVESDTGRIELRVRYLSDVLRGVVVAHKGRWLKQESSRANINALNPGRKTDMGDSSSVHGIEVHLRPINP